MRISGLRHGIILNKERTNKGDVYDEGEQRNCDQCRPKARDAWTHGNKQYTTNGGNYGHRGTNIR